MDRRTDLEVRSMNIHRWKDLQHKMGTSRLEQLRREVEQKLLDMDLRGFREQVRQTRKDGR